MAYGVENDTYELNGPGGAAPASGLLNYVNQSDLRKAVGCSLRDGAKIA